MRLFSIEFVGLWSTVNSLKVIPLFIDNKALLSPTFPTTALFSVMYNTIAQDPEVS